MTVKEIREIKKKSFQTSGKSEIVDVDTYVIAEKGIEEIEIPVFVPAPLEPSVIKTEKVQSSGKSEKLDYSLQPDEKYPFDFTGAEILALRRFINFNNGKHYTDYEIIKSIYDYLFETVVSGEDDEKRLANS